MSKKFTGVHSGGQNIPVYDKDAHSAIGQKLNTSAFQSVSGNFLTAVPESALSGYATKEYAEGAAVAAASGKLDTDTFAQVSGDFLTAVPQSYLQNTDLTVTSGKVTEISGIPLSAGGTLPDTIPVSGVSGISVTETENEVLIGISADFATSSDLESKLDTSAFSSVSGDFLTAVPDDFATKEYLSGQISGKYDTSSFAEVSGNFLTAVPESAISGFATHEEVNRKQDASAMTAYQAAGNYYSASNPSGFLTAIPEGYMQTSGLEYDGDKISGYMGSAFKAGDDLPSGVMVESAVGYNAVNEISGYNGSAIAQYGAEKQWLVHDDTLVHAANSAQYALGVNLSAVAQLLGVDETVLWSGGLTSTLSLSEPMSSFNKVRFVMHCDNTNTQVNQNLIHEVVWSNGNIITMADVVRYPANSTFPIYDYRWGANIASNGKDISNVYHEMYWHAKDSWQGGGLNDSAAYYPIKIIGIGRRSNKEESLNE